MRRPTILAGIVIALLVAGQTAHAATVQCLNCNDAQMHNKARSLGANASPHIVWNPANGAVKRYRNYCGSAPNVTTPSPMAKEADTANAAGCQLQTEELAITADLEHVTQALSQIWHGSGGTFKSSVRAHIGGMVFPTYLPGRPTAHDFLMDRQLQAQILDFASTDDIFELDPTNSLRAPLAFIASHVDAFLAMSQGVIITVDVVFDDGSKVQLRLTVGDNATYVAGSTRDNTGHILPDPADSQRSYAGRWYYPPGQGSDMTAFLEYMRSLGVTVTSGDSAGNGVITCTWNATTNTTTCVIPR